MTADPQDELTYWRDQARHWQAKAEAAERELLERNAQLDAVRIPIGGACVDHSELNGHIDIANECVDWIDTEAMDSGDPSGKLRGYVASLSIVILQLDRQRRRAERDQLRAERDAAVLSTQMKIACFVSDSLDWDRASDAALYGIVDSIESGAWKDGVKR